ncbi:putative RNA-binding protein 19 [Boothiomyces sp. JEL0838]|nr:putative RNA-binding protein 19 [Boothiomyces sp. JEL0838]
MHRILSTSVRRYSTKLFVSNLSPLTTEQSLYKTFDNYGDLKSVELKPPSNFQTPTPYAIIDYSSPEEAQKAIKMLPTHTLDRHPIICSKPKSTVYDWKLVGRDHHTKVYVSSQGMNQEKLRELATGYGTVKSMMVRFPWQRKKTGTGIVEFERKIDADRAAVGLNYSELDVTK